MNVLNHGKVAPLIFAAIIAIVGSTFYANLLFTLDAQENVTPTATPPPVLLDLPRITTYPTQPSRKVTFLPTPTSNPESVPNVTNASEPTPVINNRTTPSVAPQSVQVVARFLNTVYLCPESSQSEALSIVTNTEKQIDPLTETYTQCESEIEQKIQACINNCSSFLDVQCTENCAQTYDTQFQQCKKDYDAAKDPILSNAQTQLNQICTAL